MSTNMLRSAVACFSDIVGICHIYSRRARCRYPLQRSFATTSKFFDVMEFFDNKKKWGLQEVRSGRAWKTNELRLKSNVDLWKLWFILYKEKNMLLTMEAECERCSQVFPNPERIDRVEESMQNLQAVVAERDRAFNLVEHGVTGEPPVDLRYSGLGLRYTKHYSQYLVPYWQNNRFWMSRRARDPFLIGPRGKDFFIKYLSKQNVARRNEMRKGRRMLRNVQELYPHAPEWSKASRLLRHRITPDDIYHGKMSD